MPPESLKRKKILKAQISGYVSINLKKHTNENRTHCIMDP